MQQKLVDTLLVPSIAGATAAGVAYFGLGEKGNFPIFGSQVNGALGIFAVVTGSSVIAESAKNYILPYISDNMQYAQLEAGLVSPALVGLSTYGLCKLAAMQPVDGFFQAEPSFFRAFALGAGSEMFANYAYNNLISQYVPK